MLKFNNLKKRYGKRQVLDGISGSFEKGLHFVVGPSGSGKTTFLRILCAIDKEYDGDITINKKKLKGMSKSDITDYYRNTIGFVWQDFKLIDHLTVRQNIELSMKGIELSYKEQLARVDDVLKQLNLDKVSSRKVSMLSGGEKQRVGIGRAIIHQPIMIIADEPTGALDKKNSTNIMNILRKLSKKMMVIIVTHDLSLHSSDCYLHELKNGELHTRHEGESPKQKSKEKVIRKDLKIKEIIQVASWNLRGLFKRFVALAVIIALSTYLILFSVTGEVESQSSQIVENLIEERGDALKDIIITGHVIGGSSTEANDNTSIDFAQNIDGILEKYKDDERIEFISMTATLLDFEVGIDGVLDDYAVARSSYGPALNKVVAGNMPGVEGNEVAVTEVFLKNAGLTPEEVLNKKMSISSIVLDHDGSNSFKIENYTERPVQFDNVLIVGVIDSTVWYEDQEGNLHSMAQEDGFYYSFDLSKKINGVASSEASGFTMRVKNIEDILSIELELKEMGVTAFGDFVQIKDLLAIDDSTAVQSDLISNTMGGVGLVLLLLTTLLTQYLRQRDSAILYTLGYTRGDLLKLMVIENTFNMITAVPLYLLFILIIEKPLYKLTEMSIGMENIILGMYVTFGVSLVITVIQALWIGIVKLDKSMFGGE